MFAMGSQLIKTIILISFGHMHEYFLRGEVTLNFVQIGHAVARYEGEGVSYFMQDFSTQNWGKI